MAGAVGCSVEAAADALDIQHRKAPEEGLGVWNVLPLLPLGMLDGPADGQAHPRRCDECIPQPAVQNARKLARS